MKLFLLNLLLLICVTGNAQYCPEPEYKFSFELNEPFYLNKSVGQLYVCDPDGDQVEWSISDENMWKIKDGTILLNNSVDEDTYTFNVSVTDNGFQPLTTQAVVDVYVNRKNDMINLYPNPFSDRLNIDINLETESDINIKIINQFGENVKFITNYTETLPNGGYKYVWNGDNGNNSRVSPGVYYLITTINNKIVKISKIIFINFKN